jgi:hypothetical protein
MQLLRNTFFSFHFPYVHKENEAKQSSKLKIFFSIDWRSLAWKDDENAIEWTRLVRCENLFSMEKKKAIALKEDNKLWAWN